MINDFTIPQMYTLDRLKYHVNEVKQLYEVELLMNA